jgi:hypothetical protein
MTQLPFMQSLYRPSKMVGISSYRVIYSPMSYLRHKLKSLQSEAAISHPLTELTSCKFVSCPNFGLSEQRYFFLPDQ